MEGQWHLDKRVPIAFIFALLIQTGGLFYWGGQMETRMSNVESVQVSCKSKLAVYESEKSNQNGLLQRVDERTKSMQEDVRELKQTLRDHQKNMVK